MPGKRTRRSSTLFLLLGVFSIGSSGNKRRKESVRHFKIPDVAITKGAELPAIARIEPHVVRQIVVEAEVDLSCIGAWQSVDGRERSPLKLLESPYWLKASQPGVLSTKLGEPVSCLGPIALPIARVRVLSFDVQRHTVRLPGEMHAHGILALILQKLLVRHPDLQPRLWKKDSHSAAGRSSGLESIGGGGAERREIGRVIQFQVLPRIQRTSNHRAVTRRRC